MVTSPAAAVAVLLVVTMVAMTSAVPTGNGFIHSNNVGSIARELAREIATLDSAAREQVTVLIDSLNIPINDGPFLHVDSEGVLYYADAALPEDRRREAHEAVNQLSMEEAESRVRRFLTDNPGASTRGDGLPLLHSRPGAANTIFLDFDGHVSPDTSGWGAFDAVAFSLDSDFSAFSSTEANEIIKVWKIMAEDFSPFDVDVTTVQPSNFQQVNQAHCLFTKNVQADGVTYMPSYQAGGVAYVGVFGASYYPKYSPALVYYNQLGNNGHHMALAGSHEVGHNLALTHDGTSTAGYLSKQSGTSNYNSWGPIMGAPYGAALSQWSNGDYPDANNPQDDVNMIAARLGYAADNAGGDASSATALSLSAGNTFSTEGVILNRNDKDWYSITVPGAGTVSASAIAMTNAITYGGNNLDIQLALYDSNSNLVASAAPSDVSSASLLNVAVSAGVYYLEIDGVGTAGLYSDYGSMGQYELSGSIVVSGPTTTTTQAPTTTTTPAPTTTTTPTTTTPPPPPPPTTADPCASYQLVRNAKSCAAGCSFVNDGGVSDGCAEKHCNCGGGSGSTDSPTTTTSGGGGGGGGGVDCNARPNHPKCR